MAAMRLGHVAEAPRDFPRDIVNPVWLPDNRELDDPVAAELEIIADIPVVLRRCR